jgi:hypothetical protein
LKKNKNLITNQTFGQHQVRMFHHVPVLPAETALHWRPPPSLVADGSPVCLMVDATAGGGSHSEVRLHCICIFHFSSSLSNFLFPPHQTTGAPCKHTK